MVDPHLLTFPTLLEGVRCYTDASIPPDNLSTNLRNAGLGVFIINTNLDPVQMIYIKATLSDAASVLLAEAAALALAAIITNKLDFQQVTFLSDSQQLVQFLNAQDRTNPPEWRIKYYTQLFSNFTGQRNTRVCRIRRTQNQTADTLAKQALIHSQNPDLSGLLCTCISAAHIQCTLHEALQSVTLNSVRLLTASCC
jgi:ribonuclease HI